MPRTINPNWKIAIQRLHQDQPWVWCWDFQLQKNASVNTRAYLTGYPSIVTVNSLSFYPYPIEMGDIIETGDGLPQMEVRLSNHGRVLAQYFEVVPEDEGIIGSVATAYLANLDDTTAFLTFSFEVAGATLGDEWAVLRLEKANFFERLVPQDRFNQQRCRFRFGEGTASRPSPCGYIVNASAGFTDCGKTIDECVARGNDEASRGLTRLHPRNFGGFLGIPRQ